jgi:hypothetical protein
MVGVERGADLIVYASIVVLFYAMYRVLIRLERQNKELTDLVRSLAIHEVKAPEVSKKEGESPNHAS